jgi:hypothetical protein
MDIEYYHLMEIKGQLNRIENILIEGVTTKTWLDIKEAGFYIPVNVNFETGYCQRIS